MIKAQCLTRVPMGHQSTDNDQESCQSEQEDARLGSDPKCEKLAGFISRWLLVRSLRIARAVLCPPFFFCFFYEPADAHFRFG